MRRGKRLCRAHPFEQDCPFSRRRICALASCVMTHTHSECLSVGNMRSKVCLRHAERSASVPRTSALHWRARNVKRLDCALRLVLRHCNCPQLNERVKASQLSATGSSCVITFACKLARRSPQYIKPAVARACCWRRGDFESGFSRAVSLSKTRVGLRVPVAKGFRTGVSTSELHSRPPEQAAVQNACKMIAFFKLYLAGPLKGFVRLVLNPPHGKFSTTCLCAPL